MQKINYANSRAQRRIFLGLSAFCLAFFTACASKPAPPAAAPAEAPVAAPAAAPAEAPPTTEAPSDPAGNAAETKLAEPTGTPIKAEATINLAENMIFFEFDSFAIHKDYQDEIEAIAIYIKLNPTARFRIEGHTDDRGTREYNLALGNRRANAVNRALETFGVSPQQLENVSFGKEKPAQAGTSEEARAKNRRVEVVLAKS